jgi:hypothetical protein
MPAMCVLVVYLNNGVMMLGILLSTTLKDLVVLKGITLPLIGNLLPLGKHLKGGDTILLVNIFRS